MFKSILKKIKTCLGKKDKTISARSEMVVDFKNTPWNEVSLLPDTLKSDELILYINKTNHTFVRVGYYKEELGSIVTMMGYKINPSKLQAWMIISKDSNEWVKESSGMSLKSPYDTFPNLASTYLVEFGQNNYAEAILFDSSRRYGLCLHFNKSEERIYSVKRWIEIPSLK